MSCRARNSNAAINKSKLSAALKSNLKNSNAAINISLSTCTTIVFCALCECRSCHAKNRRHRWEACRIALAAAHFDSNALKHALYHSRRLVCFQCQGHGYSPKNVQKYHCHFCGDRGHLKFTPKDVQTANSESDRAFVCTDCVTRKLQI